MKQTIVEGWVNNLGVRLHYIDSNPEAVPALSPLVYIHGAYGTAEGFLPEMQALSPRRCVAVSLRGRGKSDAPEAGYSFAHHISDIEALVDHLGLARFCLMGWSVGVAYSIGYASHHPETLSGLILLDYPARHPAFKPEWADRGLSDHSYDWKPHAVRAIQQESTEVPLWEDLHKIPCPVLVIGGGQPEGLLKPEHVEMYRTHLPNGEIVIFDDSGHNVSKPDHDRFIRVLTTFLERIDKTEFPPTRNNSVRTLPDY